MSLVIKIYAQVSFCGSSNSFSCACIIHIIGVAVTGNLSQVTKFCNDDTSEVDQ